MESSKVRFYLQFLFILCLDDLIAELEDNGDGFRIGIKYFGIVGFADDQKLLSSSLLGLQRMLNICKAFSTSTGLIFTAHISFLTHIAGVPNVNLNLKCRFAKFLYKAINSQNGIITFLGKLCMYNIMSITGSNVSNMLYEFNMNMSDIINGSASNLMKITYTGFNALPDE